MARRRGSALLGASVVGVLLAAGCGSVGKRHAGPLLAPTSSLSAPTAATGVAPTTAVCTSAARLATWSIARRAAQLVVVPVLSASALDLRVAATAGAGGVVLLGPTPSAAVLHSDLSGAVGQFPTPPLVMADQEGGGVQRLGGDVPSLPWPATMAETMSTAQVESGAQTLGRAMLSLGVNVDLAPVLDLDGRPGPSATNPDGLRSFSPVAATAGRYGVAFSDGLAAAGVLAVAKHFPGLGGVTANTDYGPAATAPLSSLETSGLIPFEDSISAGIPAVMVSNASVPGLTSLPASLSAAAITTLLRGQLHFSGLVMTDSLSAGAVTASGYDLTEAAVTAVEAGADMVLFGSTLTPADTERLSPAPLAADTRSIVDAIVAATESGSLSVSRLDTAVEHVLDAKRIDLCPH